MKTLLLTTPGGEIKDETLNEITSSTPEGWQVELVPSGSLARTTSAPDFTMVRMDEKTRPAQVKSMIPRLAHLQALTPSGSFVTFSLKRRMLTALREIKAQQQQFEAIVKEIRQGLEKFPNPERVDISVAEFGPELAAKLSLIEAKFNIAPRSSPLDKVKEVVELGNDLRTSSGNLSAERVAKVYGVSVSKLAGWLGRTRQAVTKTPDAESLQNELGFFERVARLRAIVPEAGFLKWLRISNDELDNKKPLELLANGERQVVADLVDDILTGTPA